MSEQAVTSLNKRAYKLTLEFIEFKEMLLNRVLDCSMFMATYPLLIDHITKEARLFAKRLDTLLRGMHFRDLLGQEIFWNERMEEHMEFVAGLLDPTEEPLICDARNLAKLFDNLNKKYARNQGLISIRLLKRALMQRRRLSSSRILLRTLSGLQAEVDDNAAFGRSYFERGKSLPVHIGCIQQLKVTRSGFVAPLLYVLYFYGP